MSLRTFNESLYREHFEELASMSEIRSGWLSDRESTPDDVAGLEERMEAHLDALAQGGLVALAIAQSAARPDEPWTFYAWIAVACRTGRFDMVRDALVAQDRCCDVADNDVEPAVLRRAVADALIQHGPDDRLDAIVGELRRSPHPAGALR